MPGLIDLHTHTTASDGDCAPGELVGRAARAGIAVLGVTDHDTVAALPAAAASAAAHGIEFVPGIEITAVADRKDVHVLGYFIDAGARELQAFLAAQREDRLRRVVEMSGRLADLGMPVDLDPLIQAARATPGRSLGRPQVAAALLAAGHVASIAEAFERAIGEGCPAYVPRTGASPADVVGLIARAGGISSLAHPGLLRRSGELIPALAAAGLTAIEVYHPDHDEAQRRYYEGVARAHGLCVTGGSDYHGEAGDRTRVLGATGLPAAAYDDLRRAAGAPLQAGRPPAGPL